MKNMPFAAISSSIAESEGCRHDEKRRHTPPNVPFVPRLFLLLPYSLRRGIMEMRVSHRDAFDQSTKTMKISNERR